MSPDEIEAKVKEIICNQLEVSPEQLKPEASFIDDLKADSLAVVELVLAFEQEFKIDDPRGGHRADQDGEGRGQLHQDPREVARPGRLQGDFRGLFPRLRSLAGTCARPAALPDGSAVGSTRSSMRRVVITGLGLVTPIGNDLESTWASLLAGKSGAGPITQFDTTDFATRFGCEVKGFDASKFFDKREVKHLDRFLQFGVAAAMMAVADAGLGTKVPVGAEDRWGAYIGAGLGGVRTIEDTLAAHEAEGPALRVLAVLRHRHHHQRAARYGVDPHRRDRPEHLARLGVLDRRALDRRGVPHDPSRLCRRHDLPAAPKRRSRSSASAASTRCARCRRATTTRRTRAGRSTTIATAS